MTSGAQWERTCWVGTECLKLGTLENLGWGAREIWRKLNASRHRSCARAQYCTGGRAACLQPRRAGDARQPRLDTDLKSELCGLQRGAFGHAAACHLTPAFPNQRLAGSGGHTVLLHPAPPATSFHQDLPPAGIMDGEAVHQSFQAILQG